MVTKELIFSVKCLESKYLALIRKVDFLAFIQQLYLTIDDKSYKKEQKDSSLAVNKMKDIDIFYSVENFSVRFSSSSIDNLIGIFEKYSEPKIITLMNKKFELSLKSILNIQIKINNKYHLKPYFGISTSLKSNNHSKKRVPKGSDYKEIEQNFTNAINRVNKEFGFEEESKFYFNPNTLEEIILNGQTFVYPIAYKGGYIAKINCDFFIENVKPEVIKHILEVGIGAHKTRGFGKVRLIEDER